MGNWTITIQGTGAHHNREYPRDANVMAAAFVEDLEAAGHDIESATFTHGGRDDLRAVPYRQAPTPAPVDAAAARVGD